MATDRPVEAVIFDFFGVLVDYDEAILHGRLAPFCLNPALALATMGNLGSDPDINTGVATLEILLEKVVAQHGLNMALADFERAWVESYSWPMPGMDELLDELSRRHKLVLLSNIDSYYWNNVYAMYAPLKHFDRVLLSFDLGVAKPNPEAYMLAAKAAECDMSACLFIDDRKSNTDAAAALGMQTHTFTSVENLRTDLAKRGLL
jgi:HAD superfamily hydrolase (TIGR01509 family)